MDLGFAERKTIIYEAALEGGGGGDPRSGARKREKEKERRNGAPHRLHRFCPLLSSPNFVQVCTRGKRRCQVSNRAACAVVVRNTPSSIPNLLSLSLSLCPTPPSRDFLIKDRRKLGSQEIGGRRSRRIEVYYGVPRVEGYLLRIGPRNFYTSTRSTSSIWPRWTATRSSRRTHLEEET